MPDYITGIPVQPIQTWGSVSNSVSFKPSKKIIKKSIPPERLDKNKLYNIPLLEAFPGQLLGKEKEGLIGLEIECEGMNLFDTPISYWKTAVDHSLRAVEGHPPVEYVLRKPLSREDTTKALVYLSKKLQEVGSKVQESTRTSVHVHVNCQKLCMKQIIQIVCLYLIFEEMLVEFSGPDRAGNLFCLRAKDAEHFIQILEGALKTENYNEVFNSELRYTSCNTASLGKFGSLEFRSMRGTVDVNLIQLWIDILMIIHDKALRYMSPKEIVKAFESLGPQGYLEHIFGDNPEILSILKSQQDVNKKTWDGLRLMRDVAYAVKWEEYDPSLKQKKDPEEKERENLEEVNPYDVIEELNPGVYLQYSYQKGCWFVCNWNDQTVNMNCFGSACSFMKNRAYGIRLQDKEWTGYNPFIPWGDLSDPRYPVSEPFIPIEDTPDEDEELKEFLEEKEPEDEY